HDLAGTFDIAPGDEGDALAEGAAVLLVDVGADDEVGDAGLVLEGDEEDARGGGGALAHEDESGDGDAFAVGEAVFVGEVAGGRGRFRWRGLRCRACGRRGACPGGGRGLSWKELIGLIGLNKLIGWRLPPHLTYLTQLTHLTASPPAGNPTRWR